MTDTPQITDSHCHLDFESLQEDLPGVIARAAEADPSGEVDLRAPMATIMDEATHWREASGRGFYSSFIVF